MKGLLHPLHIKRAGFNSFYKGYDNFVNNNAGMKGLTHGLDYDSRDSGLMTAGKMFANTVNRINPLRYVGRAAQEATKGNWKGYAGNAAGALMGAAAFGGGSGVGLAASKILPSRMAGAFQPGAFASRTGWAGDGAGLLGFGMPDRNLPMNTQFQMQQAGPVNLI